MQNRREFIRQSGAACAAIAGLGFLATLESCKGPASAMATSFDKASNKISLPLSSFGTRNQLVVEGPGGDYQIFLLKKSETEITAVQLKCTHRGHWVNMEAAKLHCNLHGSEYDFDGNVTKGPAAFPLKRYPVSIENGTVQISLG